MNVERLLAVKHAILDHPKQVDMMSWYGGDAYCYEPEHLTPNVLDRCGTTGCVAGWAVSLFAPGIPYGLCGNGVYDRAIALLDTSEDAADSLFHVMNWPSDLRRRYGKARRPATRARIVAERIDRFLLEHGAVIPEPAVAPAENRQFSDTMISG